MSLINQRTYWFPSFKKFLYENGDVVTEYKVDFRFGDSNFGEPDISYMESDLIILDYQVFCNVLI